MDHRSPLQHLLHSLLPARARPGRDDVRPEFADTQALDDRAPASAPARRPLAWAESALDLARGSDITELPDDAAAELMEQFFARSGKKAA